MELKLFIHMIHIFLSPFCFHDRVSQIIVEGFITAEWRPSTIINSYQGSGHDL